ncbi:MAG: hypothetical protein HFG00_05490 [Oscillibacter sp.]|nr:hypothetical protein [Oscillibacter sp.]
MSEKRKDIWKGDDGEGEEKPGKIRGFLSFLLMLAVVLLIVLFAAYRDGTGFDILRRYLHYGSAEKVGGEVLYRYDTAPKNRFAALGESLVVLSDSSLRLLDRNGNEVWSDQVTMSNPALSACGGRAVAYDVGGTALYVLDQTGVLFELTADEEEPYIAATLNSDGWLAVTAVKKSGKGCVSVYNSAMTQTFAFTSRSRYVLDGCVLNNRLAAVTLGQENGVFLSSIGLYDLSKDAKEPEASYNISGGLVAAIGEQEGRIVTVSDTCLTYASSGGEVTANYAYQGEYLRDFDLGGDGFTVLLLNRYRSGSVGRLVTVDKTGEELGTLEVQEEILSLSASGRYLAVLYPNRLVVYNQDLQAYATLRGTDTTRAVLMRPDGSVLLLSSDAASLFLP